MDSHQSRSSPGEGNSNPLQPVFRFSSVQSLSRVQLFVTPWTAAHQASLAITNSQSLLKLMSIESVMPSNHLIFCHPLLLPPSVFPSIRVFSNESALCSRWPKYWSSSFNINPSNEYSGLISFRIDSLDLLVVQGTLKSLLQHHSSKASILRRSAFFIVQLSIPYMTTVCLPENSKNGQRSLAGYSPWGCKESDMTGRLNTHTHTHTHTHTTQPETDMVRVVL